MTIFTYFALQLAMSRDSGKCYIKHFKIARNLIDGICWCKISKQLVKNHARETRSHLKMSPIRHNPFSMTDGVNRPRKKFCFYLIFVSFLFLFSFTVYNYFHFFFQFFFFYVSCSFCFFLFLFFLFFFCCFSLLFSFFLSFVQDFI